MQAACSVLTLRVSLADAQDARLVFHLGRPVPPRLGSSPSRAHFAPPANPAARACAGRSSLRRGAKGAGAGCGHGVEDGDEGGPARRKGRIRLCAASGRAMLKFPRPSGRRHSRDSSGRRLPRSRP